MFWKSAVVSRAEDEAGEEEEEEEAEEEEEEAAEGTGGFEEGRDSTGNSLVGMRRPVRMEAVSHGNATTGVPHCAAFAHLRPRLPSAAYLAMRCVLLCFKPSV